MRRFYWPWRARDRATRERARSFISRPTHRRGRGWDALTSVLGARVTQLIEGHLQVDRIGAGHAHRHACSRVSEAETNGV